MNAGIVSLLVLIVVELVIFEVYVRKQFKYLSSRLGLKKVFIEERDNFTILEIIKQATSSIFISGISLTTLSGAGILREITDKTKHGVKVDLLLADYDNKILENQYKLLRNGYGFMQADSLLESLSKNKKVTIKTVDFVTPVLFVAIDIDVSKKGLIKAEHLLNHYNEEGEKELATRPNILLREDDNNEWYNVYKEQIKKTWEHENAVKWRSLKKIAQL